MNLNPQDKEDPFQSQRAKEPSPRVPQSNMFTPANPFATGTNFNAGGGGINPNATVSNGFPQVGATLIDSEAVQLTTSVKKKKKKKRPVVNPDAFLKQDSVLGPQPQQIGLEADALPDLDMDAESDFGDGKKRPQLQLDSDDDDFL